MLRNKKIDSLNTSLTQKYFSYFVLMMIVYDINNNVIKT